MTYNTDPSRWTDSLAEAPDALRAPFAAARNEGPSDLQMKALALKLAALSAGTAAAATAATAKAAASTTAGGAAAASAGTFSMAKVAISVALFGASITGAVVWQGKVSVRQDAQTPVVQQAPGRHSSEEPLAEQELPSAHVGKGTAGAPTTEASGATAVMPSAVPAASSAPSTAPAVGSVSVKAGVTSPADEARPVVRSSSVNARSAAANRARSNAAEASTAKLNGTVGSSSANKVHRSRPSAQCPGGAGE